MQTRHYFVEDLSRALLRSGELSYRRDAGPICDVLMKMSVSDFERPPGMLYHATGEIFLDNLCARLVAANVSVRSVEWFFSDQAAYSRGTEAWRSADGFLGRGVSAMLWWGKDRWTDMSTPVGEFGDYEKWLGDLKFVCQEFAENYGWLK